MALDALKNRDNPSKVRERVIGGKRTLIIDPGAMEEHINRQKAPPQQIHVPMPMPYWPERPTEDKKPEQPAQEWSFI